MAAPFRMGTKKVYLPSSVFTLVRGSGKLPPNQAMFHVPLHTNKFDVRDYLYNLYGLRTTNVKIMIQQGELQRGTAYQRKQETRTKGQLPMIRPAASKRAIVTMDQPFKYPDPPKGDAELEPWGSKVEKIMQKRIIRSRRGTKRELTPFMVNGRV